MAKKTTNTINSKFASRNDYFDHCKGKQDATTGPIDYKKTIGESFKVTSNKKGNK